MCACVCVAKMWFPVVGRREQSGAGQANQLLGEMLESGMGETKEASWFTELVQSEEKYF